MCAYKESPYLEECIQSLMNQTVKSDILIATATPSKYIDDIAAKYNLKVYVNHGEHGITQDWNFAYSKAETDYVTIAHQDDKYNPSYVENLMAYTKMRKTINFLYRLCRNS
ncbi:MAG: glycosyltransferase [Lachnospira eligens]